MARLFGIFTWIDMMNDTDVNQTENQSIYKNIYLFPFVLLMLLSLLPLFLAFQNS
jgi:hypothetical protein